MQNRVMQYIKESSNAIPWLGTFHSISVKFFKPSCKALGYKSNFTILDTEDQKKLIRNIVKAPRYRCKKIFSSTYHVSYRSMEK